MTTFIFRAASFGRFSATADGMENSTATSASGADGIPTPPMLFVSSRRPTTSKPYSGASFSTSFPIRP